MASILYIGTHGPVDTTRATLPFVLATGAIETGHTPAIALLTEAVLLMKANLRGQVQAVGFPSLAQLWIDLARHEVPICV